MDFLNIKQGSLFFVLATIPISSSAISFTDPIDGKFDMGEYLAENAYGFMPVPILITEPAIGYGGGAMGLFLHESDAQRKKRKQLAEKSLNGGAHLLTPAISVVGGFGTDNKTWGVFGGHRHSWNRDHIRYTGGAIYGDFNMSYYPFNSENSQLHDYSLDLSMKGYGVMQKLQFRVKDTPLLIGITQLYGGADITSQNNNKLQEALSDHFDYSPTISGLGLLIEYDALNSFLFPTNGGNYTAKYQFFREGIGSDYNYDTLQLKGTQYIPLNEKKNWILGVKSEFNSLISDERFLPPPVYPDVNLRGISRGRYQGENTITVEGQVMWSITHRWLVSAFGGVGSTARDVNGLFSDNHYSGGVGFRYLMARRYGLHAGIDLAASEEDSAIYFQVGTGL
ncbi:BamA/TamA family outer membrane protein [Vibrio sp. SS-MA-C1-2]|uniref:BamA/TamA family outer membrane protein n=1 Tax=Vibrio sp. SS-MA-C1-2 TaxID=2908646 RepID=UPI001F1AAF18|nr:BamA/TamA family outer membrane protein [Vibrio sp. SS-MA-C1-2]UJF17157.1 BamA/TamA family outer membrane protein [Vibrio sp. SS-MA-C1-2]